LERGKRSQDKVELPAGWWLRLVDVCNRKAPRERKRPGPDIYQLTGISRRSMSTARRTNKMTEQMFSDLTHAMGFERHDDLLKALAGVRGTASQSITMPKTLLFTMKKENPQGASFGDYPLPEMRPWVLTCVVATESPYFRFGFKLLAEDGRVFGDGSIQSHDPNLVLHIGRNAWDSPSSDITKDDVFLAAYANAIRLGDANRRLFRSTKFVRVSLELKMDRSYTTHLSVNGETCFSQIVTPVICHRIAILAWGDQDPFSVEVTGLSVATL
jgi:hypothetical protein